MNLHFKLLMDIFGICSLPIDSALPDWGCSGSVFSITKSPNELSIVCSEQLIPNNIKADKGWKALQILGPISFDTIGVVASVTKLLADAKLGVFVLSTYDADLILVQEKHLQTAINELAKAGHIVS